MRYEVIKAEEAPEEVNAPPGTRGLAAYDGDEIVAYVGVIQSITIDPLWIRPDRRKSPWLLRRLWEKLRALLVKEGAVAVGGVTVEDSDTARLVERIAVRLTGAEPVDCRILHINLD